MEMAGRLGVFRMLLLGLEGALAAPASASVLAVELDDAKAESRRASSSVNSVRLTAVLGAGEVLGRRTLLSHPRWSAGATAFRRACPCSAGRGGAVVASPSGVRTASALMVEGSRSCHRGSSGMAPRSGREGNEGATGGRGMLGRVRRLLSRHDYRTIQGRGIRARNGSRNTRSRATGGHATATATRAEVSQLSHANAGEKGHTCTSYMCYRDPVSRCSIRRGRPFIGPLAKRTPSRWEPHLNVACPCCPCTACVASRLPGRRYLRTQ